MDDVYPRGPASVPPDLTRPSGAYRRHVYLAVAGVALFVAAYFGLAGWFAWTAFRLFASIQHLPSNFYFTLTVAVGGASAGFLCIFMLKAAIFVRRGQYDSSLEITAADHPRLFEFLHRIADEARAPRPHRVFLSPGVNAGVFYDLSLANLILRSRKNLEIGVGLVNVLTLGEFKAVLAHEFGHFAQRTMAVGRWVYIAQQIAGHIVVSRGALDNALQQLSHTDVRIAWIGWILRLIVWSIRSLVDTLFGWVMLAQRALSCEMELQADLVAVSLTGSDALIHALHRLDAADDAMDRAVSFAAGQAGSGKPVADLYAVQTAMLERKRVILADPLHGAVPPLPADPASHRLFKAKLAHPPRMWSTHPPNHLREDNAKRRYLAAPLDDRSPWLLFEDSPGVCAEVTAHVNTKLAEASDDADADEAAEPVPLEESMRALEETMDRRFFDRCYRGVYLGRSAVRGAATADQLYDPPLSGPGIAAALDALYPETLAALLEQRHELGEEQDLLRALQRGILQAPGGVVRYRGEEHHRREIPRLVDTVDRELAEVERQLCEHDRQVRTAHRAAARLVSPAWEAYLCGLASVLHYAEHRAADLADAMETLDQLVAIVLADRKVTSDEIDRLVTQSHDLHTALRDIHVEASRMVLGESLAGWLEIEQWSQALGEFTLPSAHSDNIGQWLDAVRSWVDGALGALRALGNGALDLLLRGEEEVARLARSGAPAASTPAAPSPPQAPARYRSLVPGEERKRQDKLDWWDRFQIADGWFPAAARFTVAAAIVGSVLWAGRAAAGSEGEAVVFVVNGLPRPVTVEVGSHEVNVPALGHAEVDIPIEESLEVTTRTQDGQVIERFISKPAEVFGRCVYNVARAATLIEWDPETDERSVAGTERWSRTDARGIFDDPERVSARSDSASVLVNLSTLPPTMILGAAEQETAAPALLAAQARWSSPGTAHRGEWLRLARTLDTFDEILDAQLAAYPDDIVVRRLEQERGPRDKVCAAHRKYAENRADDPGWRYLVTRCLDGIARQEAVDLLASRWPDNGWINLAASGVAIDRGQYAEGSTLLDLAIQRLPELEGELVVRLVRVRRMTGEEIAADLRERVPMVASLLAIESDQPGEDEAPVVAAYRHQRRGEYSEAIARAAGTPAENDILVIAAASIDAPPELAERALALPVDQVTADTALYLYALAVRAGRDPASYLARFAVHSEEEKEQIARFVDAVRTGKGVGAAEQELTTVSVELRANAFAAGAVILGDKAPPAWRELAHRVLFATERPRLQ